MNTLKVLEENQDIREAMVLDEEARQRILDGYRSIRKANKNITFIYSGYENGLMLINDYTPPEGFDPTTRPWYRAAMAIKPETSIGLPYQEIKTNEWLVSTSRALRKSDGVYSGVVAIDCSMNKIVHLIAQHDEYGTDFSFVMDRSGEIIMHPDQSLLGKSLPEMKEAFQLDSKGDFTFRVDKVEYFAHYSRISSTGWAVVTVVEKREIVRPIISQVLFLIGLTCAIAVFLGLVQSTLLSRRLSRPLIELGRKIKASIAGDELDADKYVYPNNEIGIMARELGQLAEKELNAKTRALQASEEIYKTILMASPDDITIADLSGRIIMVSEAAHRIFGYGPEEGPGMSVMDFIAPEDHERARGNIVKMLQGNYPGPNEYRAIRKDGSCLDIEVNNSLIRDRQGNPVRMVLIVRDITSRKKTEQQVQELVRQLEIERDLAQRNSLTDSLTGLSNRRFFDNALRTEFLRHKRSGSQLSLIMLDVDHFKKYNDHYGHLAGDDCLLQIANALKAVVKRPPDIVARYGGEEFVVILPETDLQGAAILAGRIGEAVLGLARLHPTSDTSEFVTISLGIATAENHVLTDGAQLVALADQALYQAKKDGRNRYKVLTTSI
ncbi:MAG: diguanylate cyclase [Proteobacteria bacterium]|nr:diguanylate cyclase [Pseudomonadota bacterium]MBU1649971.1 diguanylate cyclase [Pseudomonadota bacterium]